MNFVFFLVERGILFVLIRCLMASIIVTSWFGLLVLFEGWFEVWVCVLAGVCVFVGSSILSTLSPVEGPVPLGKEDDSPEVRPLASVPVSLMIRLILSPDKLCSPEREDASPLRFILITLPVPSKRKSESISHSLLPVLVLVISFPLTPSMKVDIQFFMSSIFSYLPQKRDAASPPHPRTKKMRKYNEEKIGLSRSCAALKMTMIAIIIPIAQMNIAMKSKISRNI